MKLSWLHLQGHEELRGEVVKGIRDRVGESVDLRAMASFFEGGLNATGWDTRMVVEGPRSIVLRHSRCPEAEEAVKPRISHTRRIEF